MLNTFPLYFQFKSRMSSFPANTKTLLYPSFARRREFGHFCFSKAKRRKNLTLRSPECVNGFETLFLKNYCRSFSSFPG
jgi:hypothetical protein